MELPRTTTHTAAFALRSFDLVETGALFVVVDGEHRLAGADIADHQAGCPGAGSHGGAQLGDEVVQRGLEVVRHLDGLLDLDPAALVEDLDRKSTRLYSSH